MFGYLSQLPSEVLGQKMLAYLELIDIMHFESAAASHHSQQLLQAILPYCPPIVFAPSATFHFNSECSKWFHKRRCHVKLAQVSLKSLCQVEFEHSVLNNIELILDQTVYVQDIASLNKIDTEKRFNSIIRVMIEDYQGPTVMKVLFSMLRNSIIHSLDIGSSNLSNWFMYITRIKPHLRELSIHNCFLQLPMITAITKYCPFLEKISLTCRSDSSRILLSIASNCPHLHSLDINIIYYDTSDGADLTAFAEKCPQLEELSLYCRQLTDRSVIVLAQHCSRLKKLLLSECNITAASLIALSERGLPLEELDIHEVPILSAEIAAQCAHTLSRIRKLRTHYSSTIDDYTIQYLTGLHQLELNSSKDHLLMPHLLLLLQEHFSGLEILNVALFSSITPQQLTEIVEVCNNLHTLGINKPTFTCDAILIEMAHSCPYLQKVTVHSSEVTEEGILALAAHCRQLREMDISGATVTEETVRQLAQHCRYLTKLYVHVHTREGKIMEEHYNNYEIRSLGEKERAVV